jgi:hypothetical protein
MTLTVRSASVTGATTAARGLTYAELDANWAHVIESSNHNFTQSGSGSVSRPLQDHVRELVVNARGFGSKFASTPAADINQAIDAVNTAGGGTVLIPAGEWDLETTISVKSNVWLRGAGITATKLTLAASVNKDMIRNPNNSFGVNGPDTNIRISDMELDGNKLNNTSDGHSPDAYNACIRLKNVERCIVERVYGHDARGYGVELKSALNCVVSHCYASANGDDGFSCSEFGLGEVSHSKRNTFVSCYAWDHAADFGQTGGSGFEVDDGPQDTSFIDCYSFDNVQGLMIHEHASALAPIGVRVIGGSYYSNDEDGIQINSQGAAGLLLDNVIIDGVICDGNTTSGIQVVDASNIIIKGGIFKGSEAGIRVTNTLDFSIDGALVRGNTTYGIIVNSNSGTTADGVIKGCIVRQDSASGTNGIRISDTGVEDVVLDGNDVRDSASAAADWLADFGTRTVIRDNIGVEFRTVFLSASVNDYGPDNTGAPIWRVLSSGLTPWTITGIAKGERFIGRTLTLVNADASDAFILANQSTSSTTAANRIITGTGADLVVPPSAIVILTYDTTDSRWRVVSFQGPPAVGRLNSNTTAVGNVTTGEDNLITYAMPAQTLSRVGAGVRITAWGTAANNANAKTLKLYFGSAAMSTQTLTVSEALTWEFNALVFRTGADAQDYKARFQQEGTTEQHDLDVGTATEDDGAAITIKCTGEGVASNDIVQEGLLVEFLP